MPADDLLKIQVTSPEDRDPWLRLLVAGPGKVGKTRFASGFPNVFYADAEGRMASVADRRVPFVRITYSEQLVQLRKIMAQSPERRAELIGRPVDTLVIDTIDEVSRILATERLRETRKDNLSGDDWGWLAEQLRNFTRGFRNLPMHVIFNAHLKDTKNEFTGVLERKPNVTGGFSNEVTDYFDMNVVMRAYARGRMVEGDDGEEVAERDIRRYLQTYPEVGLDWVGDSYGRLPMEFDLHLATEEQLVGNFERLMAYVFEGGVPEVRSDTVYEEPKAEVTTDEVSDEAEPPPPAAAPTKKPAKKATATKKAAPKADPEPEPAPAPEATEPEHPVEQPETAPEPETAPAPEPATEVETEPEPEPEAAAEPETTPEPETAPEPTPEPEPAPEATESAPATEGDEASNEFHVDGEELPLCADCNTQITSVDQADLSTIRFRRPLCPSCYREAKTVERPKVDAAS